MAKVKKLLFTITICFLCLLSPSKTMAQFEGVFNKDYKLDSNDTKILYLDINNINFFKDNEFKAEKVSGYTLPGFILQPTISFQPLNRVRIDAGIHLLHYWGAEKYPFSSYIVLAEWNADKYQYGFHTTALFRAQVEISKNLDLVFGNIYANNNHCLINPLYNKELNISSDPESGMQLIYKSKYLLLDTWINWQSFMFRNNGYPETFTFGLSAELKLINNKKLEIYLPIQLIEQHIGGEVDTTTNRSSENWVNSDIGLGLKYKINNKLLKSLGFDLNLASSTNTTKDYFPFKNGYGIYPRIFAQGNNYKLGIGYWESKDFVPLLGSSHFGNISTNTSDLVFDRMKMIYTSFEYSYKYHKNYSLGFDFEYYYYFPFTGDRPGYTKVIRDGVSSFSLGLYLRMNPRFKLLKTNIE